MLDSLCQGTKTGKSSRGTWRVVKKVRAFERGTSRQLRLAARRTLNKQRKEQISRKHARLQRRSGIGEKLCHTSGVVCREAVQHLGLGKHSENVSLLAAASPLEKLKRRS